MKKETNIAALKELVNYNVLDRVKLRLNGVQAYNIAEGEEYTVLVKYEKQRGRYYFVDRDGRAEFVAGEMLAVIAEERSAAQRAAEQVKAFGSVAVCSSLCDLFFEECDILGIRVTSTTVGVDDLGRMLTRYDLVKDAEPAQQEDNNESDDNDNEGNQTPAEPSRLAKAAAVRRALAQCLTLAATYGAQRTAAALRAARRATLAAAAWLRSSHEFNAQDGDPIKCTGWQFVGFNLAAAAVVLLLSIKY